MFSGDQLLKEEAMMMTEEVFTCQLLTPETLESRTPYLRVTCALADVEKTAGEAEYQSDDSDLPAVRQVRMITSAADS